MSRHGSAMARPVYLQQRCAAEFQRAYVSCGSDSVLWAMLAQCPVCPKADSAGRFMSLALAPTPARSSKADLLADGVVVVIGPFVAMARH